LTITVLNIPILNTVLMPAIREALKNHGLICLLEAKAIIEPTEALTAI